MSSPRKENYRFITFDVLLSKQFGIELYWSKGFCHVKYDGTHDTIPDDLGVVYFGILKGLRKHMVAQNSDVSLFADPSYFSVIKTQMQDYMGYVDWDFAYPYLAEHRPDAYAKGWSNDVRQRMLSDAVFDLLMGDIPLKQGEELPLEVVEPTPVEMATYLQSLPDGKKFKPKMFEAAFAALGVGVVDGYVCGKPLYGGGDSVEDVLMVVVPVGPYNGMGKLISKMEGQVEDLGRTFLAIVDRKQMITAEEIKQMYVKRDDVVLPKYHPVGRFTAEMLEEMDQYFFAHLRQPASDLKKVHSGDQGDSTTNRKLLEGLTKRQAAGLRTIDATGLSLQELYVRISDIWDKTIGLAPQYMLFAGQAVEYGAKYKYDEESGRFRKNKEKS